MPKIRARRAALAAGLAAVLSCGSPSRDPQALFQEILASYRPFAARLAGQVSYVACKPAITEAQTESLPRPFCGADDLSKVDIPSLCSAAPARSDLARKLRELVRQASRAERREAPAEAFRLAGVAELLARERKSQWQSVMDRLEEWSRRHPRNVEVLIDLSAAYSHRAAVDDQPELVALALDRAEAAAALAPGRHEALFNRALIAGELGLRHYARSAWSAYLAVDPVGPWADEARERRARLEREDASRWSEEIRQAVRTAAEEGDASRLRRLANQHRQPVREWAERGLLQEWADAVARGNEAEAAAAFAVLRPVTEALAELTGDVLLRDAHSAIERASEETRVGLARGHRRLLEGYTSLYSDWTPEHARDLFGQAEGDLSAGDSPFAFWARFFLGLSAYYANRYGEAETILRRLQGELPSEYRVLQGRVEWVRGLVAAALERLQGAADHYTKAASIFCRLGEQENWAATQSLLASATSKLGRKDLSWAHVYAALQRAPRIVNPIRHHAILEDTVLNARRQGLEHLALALSNEHVPIAEKAGGAQILHNAYMRRGSIQAALGDRAEAQQDFVSAAQAFERLQSPELRLRADADRAMAQGAALVASDPRRAVQYLSLAAQAFAAQSYVQPLAETYHLRSRAFLNQGDVVKAERDLSQEIRLLDLARQGVVEYRDRAALTRRTRSAYDAMIGLLVGSGKHRQAFHVAEQGRVALREEKRTPLPIELLQERLSPGTALLSVTLLDDRTVLWLVTKEDFRVTVRETGEREINALAANLRSQLVGGVGEGWLAPARRLYAEIVAPVEPWLQGYRQLVVVADDGLQTVPFETFARAGSDRLVVEDFAVVYAPSAALYAHLTDQARLRVKTGKPSVLAIYASGGFETLDDLPGAEREAKAVVALYPRGRVIDGAATPKPSLLAALAGVNILHFAGHAVREPGPNGKTRLVLSQEGGTLQHLDASELGAASAELRLVVLASCGTAKADPAAGDPLGSLVEPLLASGIPAVVGSLWDVEDGAAEDLLRLFHRELASGVEAAMAMRQTKLKLMKVGARKSNRREWAGVLFMGSPG